MPDQPTAPRRPSESEKLALAIVDCVHRYPNASRRGIAAYILSLVEQIATSPRASELDTERAALHRDLDARFPLFRDFAEFVGSRRHTDHSMPCPCCGIHLSPEDEAGDPRASEPEHLEDAVRKLTRWMPNVDGRSMVTELDGQWLSRADAIEAVGQRPALGVPQEEGK